MNEILGAVIILLQIIVIIALFIVIKKSGKQTDDDGKSSEIFDKLIKGVADEFQRSRSDSSNFQNTLRGELDKKNGEINIKLNDMTKGNYEHHIQLSKLLTNSLDTIREKNLEHNERLTNAVAQAMAKMQESNETKLEAMRKTVDEKLTETLTTRLDSSFKTVSEQLENLYKSLGEMKELSTGVTDNVTALNRVLTNVKVRGTWAEVLLESILDQTIPNMYEKNYKSPGVNGQVEFAIRIPASDDPAQMTYLPIDSKFPMEDYIRICDAADRADADAVKMHRTSLENKIIDEAKKIGKYINLPYTTPYAIMYLATEGLYAEVASSKNGILEKLQNEYNIMIAGPSTITALLNSFAMGLRSVAINQKANEIRILLGAIKQQYDKFGEHLGRARKGIESASKNLEEAEHRNSIIQKRLRNIEELEAKEADNVLLE